ncbi:hypothetical protein [Streptococcus pluranimalium]|uniref:DUF4767 domain-containing protein n=1 Tax=Streptococcus pluranimalium TaxID=82348 RepID=A0A2L0D420_9STRE|nr:hypothetical protein [Streptococcus pluranimalium]AUW96339.1 hypothetical protein C0J00_04015 [Streptococcus pluranimalium]
MGNKLKKVFWLVSLLFLVACTMSKKSEKLTVTTIHNEIKIGTTTPSDLRKNFGKPSDSVKNPQKAQELEEYWNDYEGGVNYSLEDNTDYWETLHYSDSNNIYGNKDIQEYYKYTGPNLGVKSVYFFIIDNKVVSFAFEGEIINKSVAKKDKYLRQILD